MPLEVHSSAPVPLPGMSSFPHPVCLSGSCLSFRTHSAVIPKAHYTVSTSAGSLRAGPASKLPSCPTAAQLRVSSAASGLNQTTLLFPAVHFQHRPFPEGPERRGETPEERGEAERDPKRPADLAIAVGAIALLQPRAPGARSRPIGRQRRRQRGGGAATLTGGESQALRGGGHVGLAPAKGTEPKRAGFPPRVLPGGGVEGTSEDAVLQT